MTTLPPVKQAAGVTSQAAAAVRPERPATLRHGRARPGAFVVPLLLLTVIGFDIPVLLILTYSVWGPSGLTFGYYEALAGTPVFLRVIGNTFRITLIATGVVAVLGYALAYWIKDLAPNRRNIALAMVVLTFWVSILVRTYAWVVVLGNGGLVNRLLQWTGLTGMPVGFLYNDLGVIIGTANIQLPLLVLPLYAAMVRIDPRLIQAAASLGASNRTIFWKVFFPLTMPALAASLMLVMILSIGFYVTPAILGGGRVPMIANMLDIYINRLPRWEIASAVSVVLLSATMLLFMLYRRLDRQVGHES